MTTIDVVNTKGKKVSTVELFHCFPPQNARNGMEKTLVRLEHKGNRSVVHLLFADRSLASRLLPRQQTYRPHSDPGQSTSVTGTRPWQHTHYHEQMCCQRQRYRPKRSTINDQPAWMLWANGGTECNPQCIKAVAWAASCGIPPTTGITPRTVCFAR